MKNFITNLIFMPIDINIKFNKICAIFSTSLLRAKYKS